MEAKSVLNKLIIILLFSCGIETVHSQTLPLNEYYILFKNTKEYNTQKIFWGNNKEFLFFNFEDKNKKNWWTIQYKFDNKRKQKEIIYPWNFKKICFYDPFFVYNEIENLKKSKQKLPPIYIVEKDKAQNIYYRYHVEAEYPPPPPIPAIESIIKAEEIPIE